MKKNYCAEIKMNPANVTQCSIATNYSYNSDLKSALSNQILNYFKFHHEYPYYTYNT